MIKRFALVFLALLILSLSIYAGHRPVGNGMTEECFCGEDCIEDYPGEPIKPECD